MSSTVCLVKGKKSTILEREREREKTGGRGGAGRIVQVLFIELPSKS